MWLAISTCPYLHNRRRELVIKLVVNGRSSRGADRQVRLRTEHERHRPHEVS
jgi:hypothetical protein